jgi:hypothetical protein
MRFLSGICVLLLMASSPDSYVEDCSGHDQVESRALCRFDEFLNENCEVELARLDGLSSKLQNNPDYQAYIIVYGGQQGRQYEALAYAARMRFYLTRTRRLDSRRIITIDGGYRENVTSEFWIGQHGQPMPAPKPTVSAKDVRLKGRAKIVGYDCGAKLGL